MEMRLVNSKCTTGIRQPEEARNEDWWTRRTVCEDECPQEDEAVSIHKCKKK
jgi:hypothetical protein